ncbi:hypothetical protein MSAN_01135500 [Mycena sanguinolenta]|uniref:F-box domain-containing protein n=1 Tax=Mycena sanguinolenta TaxID=230812 RepID=A0A8H6YL66_9AGAR|nr:hypothetical protein MSAN_01135500 [Mycena sanguinolenta]
MEVPESSSIDDLDAKACSLQLDDPLHQPPPFLLLPPEIVAEIFVNFLPIYPTFPSHSGKLSPLLLCQVCRHWRDIALSTPALWKNISIDVQDPDDHQDQKLERLKTWTARSSRQSWRIAIAGEHLEVLVPFDSLHLLKGEMPLLRDLTFGPIDLRHDVHSALSLFQHAPALHHITLTSCFLNATVVLPWAQLTHLDAHCLYEHECTDILRAAPLLVTCTLSVCCSDDDIVIGPAVPVHTNLASVSLLAEDPDVRLWLVLDCLTLPALRRLQVAEPCVTLGGLAAFVARSGCVLDELTITDATLEEEAVREVLPSVGEISMDRKITLQSWDR